MAATTHAPGEHATERLVARIARYVGLLFLAALVLGCADVALVALRARPSPLALLRYASVTISAAAWTALAAGAGTAALAALGAGALDRLGLRGVKRAALSALGFGLLLGTVALVLIRPWNLYQDTRALSTAVPLACMLGSAGARFARTRLPARVYALLGLSAAIAAFLADAAFYRGLYVTLHRALLLCAWVTAAAALAPLAPFARRRFGLGTAAIAAFAHLGLGGVAEARELGVLHGALQPKLVAVVQALADRDGDGYSAAFGGGDCDDGDRAVYPGACERHGNRSDDNCNDAIDAPAPQRPAIPRSPRTPLPDVYLLLLDTVRADFGGVPRWPALEALARESLDFRRAYAPYPATYRSVMATLYSRSARQLDPRAPELFGLCARAGYDAQLWIGRERISLAPGTARSWLPHAQPFGPRGEGPERWSADIIAAAVAELAQPSQGAPRLRWLHLLDAHEPWRHAPARGTARERYVAELAHVSSQVARLLAALAQTERGRRAVIAVFADHGEQLGEHGSYFHDAFLWEESIRVPLILRLPGVAPRVIEAPASLIDLAPTLASYLGLSTPASFQGHDWLTEPRARAAPPVAEVSGNDSFGGVGRPARHAVIGPRYKLMLNVSENLFELYDLARDPREQRPLVQDAVREAAGLRAQLARWQDAPECNAQ